MLSPQITWSDLELVLAIHQAGTLSGAGEKLNVRQSTITRRLQELEERLGTALFVRTREGVIATSFGDSWLAPAQQAEWGVIEARRLMAKHQQGIHGRVRVATLHTIADYVLVPHLKGLLAQHPGLELSVEPSPMVVDMARLEADIAIRLVRPTSGDLVVRSLASRTERPYASHELKSRLARLPARQWPWISWAQPHYEPPPMRAFFNEMGIHPSLLFSSATTMIEATRHGLGVMFISDGLAQTLPELAPMPVDERWCYPVSLWLLGHQHTRHMPHIAAVWDWLLTVIGTVDEPTPTI